MYTLDLLKGQGLPRQLQGKQVFLFIVLVLSPGLLAAAALAMYTHNNSQLEELKADLVRYETARQEISELQEFVDHVMTEKQVMEDSLKNVAEVVTSHVPCSPILRVITEQLPPQLNFAEIELRRKPFQEKVRLAENPDKPVEVVFYRFTLKMKIECTRDHGASDLVREFIRRIEEDSWFAPRIQEIKVVAHYIDTDSQMSDRDIYEVECSFKPVR